MNNNNYGVIMAGGVGSRFWPWSRTKQPKQFLDILGTGKSLIQQSFERLIQFCPAENIYVVTNMMYENLVIKHLPIIPKDNILLEPTMRNTAPCIAYAAHKINKTNPNATIIVSPADHIIIKEKVFIDVVNKGLEFAAHNNALITIGIQPHRPETGYGYIRISKNDIIEQTDIYQFCKVMQFAEKPDYEKAVQYCSSGEYFWNSGMFIWSVKSIICALEKHLPNVNDLFQDLKDSFNTENEKQAIQQIYEKSESISIDYGIMEKADNVYVLCTDIGWSDVGTWGSLYEHSRLDENGNAIRNNKILLYDSTNTLVRLEDNKIAVIQGLNDYLVVEEDNALLICRKKDEQKIRNFVTDIKNKFGNEFI